MENVRNYAKELEKLIAAKDRKWNKLLLHSCCAPCSSYVLEYLREYFDITVFYYNPNITEDVEYQKRVEEQKRLIETYNEQIEKQDFPGMRSTRKAKKIEVIDGDYEPENFYRMAKGLEQCPEGGERCFGCYELRLRKTAELAAAEKFDCFTTTLRKRRAIRGLSNYRHSLAYTARIIVDAYIQKMGNDSSCMAWM